MGCRESGEKQWLVERVKARVMLDKLVMILLWWHSDILTCRAVLLYVSRVC
jgi:hypothetical protein